MVATTLGSRLGNLGGGVLVMFTIGFFTWFGWLDVPFFMFGMITMIGIYLLRGD